MSIIAYRKLTLHSLDEKINTLRAEVKQSRFDIRVGKDSDSSSIGKKRRELARMLTVYNEKVTLGETNDTDVADEKSSSKKVTKNEKTKK